MEALGIRRINNWAEWVKLEWEVAWEFVFFSVQRTVRSKLAAGENISHLVWYTRHTKSSGRFVVATWSTLVSLYQKLPILSAIWVIFPLLLFDFWTATIVGTRESGNGNLKNSAQFELIVSTIFKFNQKNSQKPKQSLKLVTLPIQSKQFVSMESMCSK